MQIAHIVNPVAVKKTSDLHAAQPVTFASMREAQDFARGEVAVRLLSAQFPEDEKIVPSWIDKTAHLERSVLDVGDFEQRRKLPILADILNRLGEVSDADYCIYSNVDIAPMPYFYRTIAQFIEGGIDAMVINRRTIVKHPSDPAQLPLIWAQAGENHPGHDCFVFKRTLLPKFELGEVCLGINWVGRVLLWNLAALADNFREFTNLHLTFHLGNDKTWKNDAYKDYVAHNRREAEKCVRQLEKTVGRDFLQEKIGVYLEDIGLSGPASKNKNCSFWSKMFRSGS